MYMSLVVCLVFFFFSCFYLLNLVRVTPLLCRVTLLDSEHLAPSNGRKSTLFFLLIQVQRTLVSKIIIISIEKKNNTFKKKPQ